MKLSVIVPVYNTAADGNLEYCINSLVHQSLQDMEVVAVDDCSTDNSLQILRRFEKEYPGRVKVVASPENRRQGGARNLGLKAAEGEYIGFMDSDDWMMPDLYERMVARAEETGADVVATDMCLVYEHTMTPTERYACNDMSQVGVLDHEKRKQLILKSGPLGTKIYHRDIFFSKEFQFPEHMSYEDNATSVEIVMRMKHFEYIPEPTVFYYQHDNSTTHFITQKKLDDRMEAARIMLRYAKENGAFEEFHDEIEYLYGVLFYRNTLFIYMQSNMKMSVKFLDKLRDETLAIFPKFRENPYFLKEVDSWQRNLIDLQMKSTPYFLFIYALKQISKKIKRK
ncbi:MAG: glycosyltransferase [Lachnospiraceae bacterium]|nr:glycosyltransferase [Lachnospiraceae bacterium]